MKTNNFYYILFSKTKDSSSSLPVSIEFTKFYLRIKEYEIIEGINNKRYEGSDISKYAFTFSFPSGNRTKRVQVADSIEFFKQTDPSTELPNVFTIALKEQLKHSANIMKKTSNLKLGCAVFNNDLDVNFNANLSYIY
jgi:hypothetical protein